MIELFLTTFVTFFVVIDPPGCAPIFAGFTGSATPAERRAMAFRAVFVSFTVLLLFGILGEALLDVLGIQLDSFRVAGGIMLFLIALEMVFERRTQRREDRAQRIQNDSTVEDVSVFPMAVPMIAGPGSIATIMLLTGENDGIDRALVIFGAMTLVLLLTLLALISAAPLMKFLGQRVESVVVRLLGVLLAALAVQFVADGINGLF